ncbi:Uncharacterised protein [Vibrio cholerae]|nr:Uncharacterised protein [Vibrio cholerae]
MKQRIGGSFVPFSSLTHLRRHHGDEFTKLGIEYGPAITKMFM